LACRTVDDRVALVKRFFDAETLQAQSEVVRLLEDVDGDGRSDRSRVFADGFRSVLDGCASDVLARGDEVWLANVPSVWHLGQGGRRKELLRGFGVRFGNSGHDLHGLAWGPDGKIYVSMGDRGLNVGGIALPDEGAVVRFNPDGSGLELVARGLRNPQGLCFDAEGNLFTCDNNADMGDKARWLHIVEGADYGWRVGYQYATDPWVHTPLKKPHYLTISRDVPWNTEGIWRGEAAYALPPGGHVSSGPCGIAFDPGTGLPEAFRGRFFLADFPGGIHTVSLRSKGASFEIAETGKALWNAWPTDCAFGPDGALYVADWVQGFPMTGKGRVFRLAGPPTPLAEETRRILGEGMAGRPLEELERLLVHADLRVRQSAQQEFVDRKQVPCSKSLHALWVRGQLGASVVEFLSDKDRAIRAQACRTLGDRREGFDALLPLLQDPEPRVRMHAMIALGKAGGRKALEPALAFLKENGDDPFLRHAAVYALEQSGDPKALAEAGSHVGIVLALRRLGSPEVARFLRDPDPAIAFEAARAINDVPIEAALPALADRLPDSPEPLRLRAIYAAFRRGTSKDAQALARCGHPEAVRALAAWGRPAQRNRLTGAWQPLASRDEGPAREAFAAAHADLLKNPATRREAVRAAAHFGLAVDLVEAIALEPGPDRTEALEALLTLDAARAERAIAAAPLDADVVRLAARLPRPLPVLAEAAVNGPLPVRQAAIAALGAVSGADDLLSGFLDQMDRLPAELHLDILEAAGRRPSMRSRVDTIDPTPALLVGGDRQSGKKIFFERSTVACLRCHKVGTSGGDVGPPMTVVGKERTRAQILESILYPNRVLVQGYGQEVVRTTSDAIEVGRIKSETEAELVLILADGREKRIPKANIAARKAGMSAMPDDLAKQLSKRDLRDLVEYLASLKGM
ncbi:MAG TPA: HEAT repeat domain-containing protein, partial [Planctomycetota bacterium]|nr:HEAT repeat domain-containing protein [Planctomycetota bacterium]